MYISTATNCWQDATIVARTEKPPALNQGATCKINKSQLQYYIYIYILYMSACALIMRGNNNKIVRAAFTFIHDAAS